MTRPRRRQGKSDSGRGSEADPLRWSDFVGRKDRWVVYVDDTGPAGDATAATMLPPDRKTYVAVILTPQQQLRISEVMPQLLTVLRERTAESEIHCAELMAGKRGFCAMPIAERLDFLEALAEMFRELQLRLLVQSLDSRDSGNVFEYFRKNLPAGVPGFSPRRGSDLALLLLLRRLREFLRSELQTEERAVVVVDQGWKPAGRAYGLRGWSDVFDEGLLFSASSAAVPGLQLADFAAWSLNRHQRLLAMPALDPLDKRLLEITASVATNFMNLSPQAGVLEQDVDGRFRLVRSKKTE